MKVKSKRIDCYFKRSLVGFFSFWLFVSVTAMSQAAENRQWCQNQGWPWQQSDLTPDDNLVSGQLENGFRYLILPNKEPAKRVALYLNVMVGSLVEEEETRGLAHYLEHMVFNGTTHYPPGTLVAYFQNLGMSFGADTNAHTSYDETVYKILLPSSEPAQLAEGLQVLEDYATGALLLPAEVERERGVILAEKRDRDSAAYRVYQQQMAVLLADTLVADRLPIGTDAALRGMTATRMTQFYRGWYRPENMVLVVVGDLTPDQAEPLIKKQFADLKGVGEAATCADFGTLRKEPVRGLHIHEPELGYTEVGIESVYAVPERVDRQSRRLALLAEQVGVSIFNHRLSRLLREEPGIFTEASLHAGLFLGHLRYVSLSSHTTAAQWQAGLDRLSTLLAQALKHGFSAKELARVKKEIQAELHQRLETTAGRDSSDLAAALVDHHNSGEVFLSPAQELALYQPMLNKMDVAAVNHAFQVLWGHDNRVVQVVGTANLKEQAGAAGDYLTARHLQKMGEAVSAYKAAASVPFPYLSVAEAELEKPEVTPLTALDAWQYRFANGTLLFVKKTDFEPNKVVVTTHFGQGRLSEPVPGMAALAEAVVPESGLGQLARDELAAALAGRNAGMGFKVGPESFTLAGHGLSAELALILQLMQHQLQDPAFRTTAFDLSHERFMQMYEGMAHSAEGVLGLHGDRFLASGSTRYGLPTRSEMAAVTLSGLEKWLRPAFRQAGPLEIGVVGDVDIQETVQLVSRYLASLKRVGEDKKPTQAVVFPQGETLSLPVVTEIEKGLAMVAWPTADYWDISRTRRLHVLGGLLDDRLRLELRESMGAAYSPTVYNRGSRVDAGYGVLKAAVLLKPTQIPEVIEKILAAGVSLATTEVSADELKRAVEPMLTSIRDMQRTNRYWLSSVFSLAGRHPSQLQWPLTIQQDFAAITPAEIAKLAQQYLITSAAAKIILLPDQATNKTTVPVVK